MKDDLVRYWTLYCALYVFLGIVLAGAAASVYNWFVVRKLSDKLDRALDLCGCECPTCSYHCQACDDAHEQEE